MAYHHAGRPAEAREQLAAAKAAIDSWANTVLRNRAYSTPNAHWYDWVELLVYYREAVNLIDGRPPPEDPRFRAARGISLAALGRHDAAAAEFAAATRLAPADPMIGLEAFRHAVRHGPAATADAECARLQALPARGGAAIAGKKLFHLEAYRLYATHGRPDRAAAVLADAVRRWPDELRFRVEPVRFHAEQGDDAAVRTAAVEIARHRPDDADFRLDCAGAYVQMGQWSLARGELEQAARMKPEDSAAWPKRAAVLLQLGDDEGYRALCRDLFARHGPTASGEAAAHLVLTCVMRPDAVADPAVLLPVAGRMGGAKTSVHSRGLLGAAQVRAGRAAEAAATLGEVTRDAVVGDGVIFMRIFLALAQQKLSKAQSAADWRRAADDWVKGVTFSPQAYPWPGTGAFWEYPVAVQHLAREADAVLNPPARLTAREFMKQRQWDKAIATLDGVLGPGRGEPDDWQLRADCHAAREDWQKARADYGEAVRRGSKAITQAWYPYAVLCLKAGDVAEYRATCRRLLEHFPEPDDRGADHVAVICKLDPRAGVDLTVLLRWADRWSHNPGLTGQLLYRLDRFAEAEQSLRPVVEVGRNAWNEFVLAMCYVRLGRPAEARKIFRAAVARHEATAPTLAWVYRMDQEMLRAEAAAVVEPAND
jgi:tetratricopeptide (TPR) repeat protein